MGLILWVPVILLPRKQPTFLQQFFVELLPKGIAQEKAGIGRIADTEASDGFVIETTVFEVLARMRSFRAFQAFLEKRSGEFMDLMQSTQAFPDEPLQREELQQSVQRTVMSMPEHLREILLLSYFHQFPYKQISDILEIPLGTVKSRLHAAVAHFADRWKSTNHHRMLP